MAHTSQRKTDRPDLIEDAKIDPALRAASSRVRPRLITPDEAIGRIGLLLGYEGIDLKQRLLSIAGIAIAGVITIDGDVVGVEEIDGLQGYVNRALFSDAQQ